MAGLTGKKGGKAGSEKPIGDLQSGGVGGFNSPGSLSVLITTTKTNHYPIPGIAATTVYSWVARDVIIF